MNRNETERPVFPKRAVITAGMPYGNKELHFGHVGGVFVHADIFARFLRDRLGPENVVFVSGTDCYGSSIEIGYEQAVAQGFQGSVQDYVSRNHEKQKETLSRFQVSLDLFAGSALGEAGEIHTALSQEIFQRLYEVGALQVEQTVQFFDEDKQVFLNGRQVVGRCPINGCRAETAYADECALGHQYDPSELIAPISVLSGKAPARVPVKNWFFDLLRFRNSVSQAMDTWRNGSDCRETLLHVIGEFLNKPAVYVKKELMEEVQAISGMPPFAVVEEENKGSFALEFDSLEARKQGVALLKEQGIRCRTGKTLVPFRLSGNVKWGIPVPVVEGMENLTFWVWPESLWAPISFTKAVLGDGVEGNRWESFWKSPEAQVYQFIGEDNIYFYAIAEIGLLAGLEQGYQLPHIIPNRHLLYGKKKASSSGANKPPMAAELLDHYTPEQLRLHFMNASLSERSVGFEPKAFMGGPAGGFDTVLYEGNLVTNVLNRLVRSCFYTLQKQGGNCLPQGTVSPAVLEQAEAVILEYERKMAALSFDKIFELLNLYLKDANKDWSVRSKTEDPQALTQLLVDTFHVVRVAATLFHPIVPEGCEMIRDYLQADDRLWSWDYISQSLSFFTSPDRPFRFLEPRVDFFSKHPTQLEK